MSFKARQGIDFGDSYSLGRGFPNEVAGLHLRGGALTLASGGLTITAGGLTISGGGMTVVGAITTTTTLTVDGASTLTGNVTAAGTLTSTGAFTTSQTLTPGAGTSDAETRDSGVWTNGTIIITRLLIDLTNLTNEATDLDIIGENLAADCHWGQITTALNGAMEGGMMTCLETPVGGAIDIDLYSTTTSGGVEGAAVTGMTQTAILTRGAVWAEGDVIAMTGIIPPNDYLYLVSGTTTGGDITAGKFLIEIYGS